jgi:hypothetical protein
MDFYVHEKVPKHANLSNLSENMGFRLKNFHGFISFLNMKFRPKSDKYVKNASKKIKKNRTFHCQRFQLNLFTGNRPAAPMPSADEKSALLSSSNSFEDNISAANHDGNDDHVCSDGWMNFHNRVCFNGLKVKRPFFEGVKDCGDLGVISH